MITNMIKLKGCLSKVEGCRTRGDQNSGRQMVLLWELENLFTTATPSLRIAKSSEISSEGSQILSHE